MVLCRDVCPAQPVGVLVLKRLRRQGNGLKSHPTDWEKPGIEPATPGLQDMVYPLHYDGGVICIWRQIK